MGELFIDSCKFKINLTAFTLKLIKDVFGTFKYWIWYIELEYEENTIKIHQILYLKNLKSLFFSQEGMFSKFSVFFRYEICI